MDITDEEHHSEPEENNSEEENNENQVNDDARNQPETFQDPGDNVSDEYKPFDNNSSSSLSPAIIKKKIDTVLHFASLPVAEDGTSLFFFITVHPVIPLLYLMTFAQLCFVEELMMWTINYSHCSPNAGDISAMKLTTEKSDKLKLIASRTHTNHDTSMNPSLPADFFSVEHVLQREKELYNPGSHLLQNLIDQVKSLVLWKKPNSSVFCGKLEGRNTVPEVVEGRNTVPEAVEGRNTVPEAVEGRNTVPEVGLLVSIGYQERLQQTVTAQNDNSGNNFKHLPLSSPQFSSCLLAASGQSVLNYLAQFNLNASLSGTPAVTAISQLLHKPSSSDQQVLKLKNVRGNGIPTSDPCGYCIATYKFPQNHDRKECPKLACMKPCKVCHASGLQNHTLIESPILRVIRSVPLAWMFYNIILEHCPFKKKITLKLKYDKRSDDDKDNKDDKSDKDDRED
uniref:Nanos-type domain-containing protein n=1 Tax=Loa loa TaxID=7209 RepID=A0A1I7VQK6_LOALO